MEKYLITKTTWAVNRSHTFNHHYSFVNIIIVLHAFSMSKKYKFDIVTLHLT